MLGTGKKRRKAVEQAELYLASMFTGLAGPEGRPPPYQAFADPYVAGFLEVLTTHAVATVYRYFMPGTDAVRSIMGEAIDRIWPGEGYGATARHGLTGYAKPAHALHAQYQRGREAGVEHVRTLFISDGIARNEPHRMFRDYLKAHYLEAG